MFGLVKWTCDDVYKGGKVSFFECAECSMYCVYNQYFEKCRSNAVPILLAIILACILSLSVLVLCLTVFRPKIKSMFMDVLMFFLMRSDRRRAERIKKFNKITGQRLEVKFKEIKYTNLDIMNEVVKRRLALSGKDSDKEELYAEIIYQGSADERDVNYMLRKSEKRLADFRTMKMHQRPTYKPKYAPAMNIVRGTAILAAIGTTPVYGCDQMLYLKSNGRICYKDSCYDLSTYSLMLADGETACFNDVNNERLSIKFTRMEHHTRFSKLYDTCDYNITNTMTWNCYGAGKCWGGEECGNGYVLNVLAQDSNNPHGYGCHMAPVSCTSGCFHGVSCVWYRWEVLPDLKNTASIFESTSEFWVGKMTVTYKGVSQRIELNTIQTLENITRNRSVLRFTTSGP